jgi:hypothetical protein
VKEIILDVCAGLVVILPAIGLTAVLRFAWVHGERWPTWGVLAIFALLAVGSLGSALRNRLD